MKYFLYITLTLNLIIGCGPDTPEISGFESYVWKRDKYGCGGERREMVEKLMESREKVMGLREAEVLRLLGRADEQEIYSRNQKFLIYFLEPNLKCTAPENVKATAKALFVRINAIGVANELYTDAR